MVYYEKLYTMLKKWWGSTLQLLYFCGVSAYKKYAPPASDEKLYITISIELRSKQK